MHVSSLQFVNYRGKNTEPAYRIGRCYLKLTLKLIVYLVRDLLWHRKVMGKTIVIVNNSNNNHHQELESVVGEIRHCPRKIKWNSSCYTQSFVYLLQIHLILWSVLLLLSVFSSQIIIPKGINGCSCVLIYWFFIILTHLWLFVQYFAFTCNIRPKVSV